MHIRNVANVLTSTLLALLTMMPVARIFADEPQPVVIDQVDGMALSGTTLYWTSNCGVDFSPGRSRLRSTSTNTTPGAEIHTLYHPAGCQSDRVASIVSRLSTSCGRNRHPVVPTRWCNGSRTNDVQRRTS